MPMRLLKLTHALIPSTIISKMNGAIEIGVFNSMLVSIDSAAYRIEK